MSSLHEIPSGILTTFAPPSNISLSKVSVVITCYNYGKYLRSSLESVLVQTYPQFEIIVVNDGSTDDTDEIIKEYLPSEKIIYINQSNQGTGRAKNIGIGHATGQFIAFLDADDIWEKNKLEMQLPFFKDKRVGVVYGRARVIDQLGREIRNRDKDKYRIPRSGSVAKYLFVANFIPFSSAVVRRECLDKVGSFDESLKMVMDWDLWLRISPYYDFAFLDRVLISYRVGHVGQLSRNLEERQRCEDKILQSFLENNPGIIPKPIIRRSSVYCCIMRGINWRHRDIYLSSRYFTVAIRKNMWEFSAYVGLMKNLALFLLRFIGFLSPRETAGL